MQTQVLGWLIAGSIASWLAHETSGRGPLGLAMDWLVGLAGSILGVLVVPPIVWLAFFVQALIHKETIGPLDWWGSIQGMNWWVSTPLAFAGAVLLIRLFRALFRVHVSP